YGNVNTPDKELVRCWVELGEEINSFRKAHKSPVQEVGELPAVNKLQNALIDNYKLLENVRDLEAIRDRLQKLLSTSQRKLKELEVVTRRHELSALQHQSASPVVANLQIRPHLISPDAERRGSDQLALKKAWVLALNQLRIALARPVEKKLFITVGAPGSGKSTWCRSFSGDKGVSILFDACNLTQSDRYELLDIARQYENTKVIAVVFYADLRTLEARNMIREDSKKVPVSKLRTMYNNIEYPSLVDGVEFFDEIIMLRG
ncbi:hypothetical protein, partial [Comamonas sp.]|uniref:hypothetical protein n=1 Tax=Comamonas sp. TaxID=34028 RepID=UPI002647E274